MESLLILLALSTANLKPVDVANLVTEKDAAAIVDPLRAALASDDALTRATAARVIAVRDVKPLVADLRAAVEHEQDGTAAREELRGIAILGDAADVDFAIAASAKWPSSMNTDVANAVARRGAADAMSFYFSKLHSMPNLARKEFFRIALWGRPAAATAAAARILGIRDTAAWRDLISVLRESDVELNAGVAAAALSSSSEELRNDLVWHFVRRFAGHPDEMPQPVRDAFAAPAEQASDREAYGRELVRRSLGGEKKEDPRWLAWLETKEADDLLGYNEPDVYALLSDREFALRKSHCGELPVECAMPKVKPQRGGRIIHSTAVRAPEMVLPGSLPAGLGQAIASRCPEPWFGLAGVTVDGAGRVDKVDLSRVLGHCVHQMETLLRLSYATNTSIVSSRSSDDVILSHAKGADLCLDEAQPSNDMPIALAHSGGRIVAPKVRRRVEPIYPGSLLGDNKARGSALVILEAMITKEGCVRNIRILAQTPFPELNTSAVYALSQWTFYPGTIDGKPVDVLYNLTINFKQ